MAFCAACGNEVVDTAVVCVKCGSSIGTPKVVDATEPWSTGKMVGYGAASFLIPIIGVILGFIGVSKESRRMQGVILLAISIFSFFFWNAIFK